MEQLVVRLGANSNETVHWIVWSSQQNEIIASGVLANANELSSLKERAGQRAITVLVPTSDVLLKWVELPAKASRKALAAIPYMLEDEISGDINQQFFALGPQKNNVQAVAVVSKEKLKQWLAMISDAGLVCEQLIPDVLAIPQATQGWALLVLGQQLLVRQDEWAGLQGEKDWLVQAVTLHARQYQKAHAEPLQLNNYAELQFDDVSNIESHSMPLELPMKVLASGIANAKFNLLQGEFKRKSSRSAGWKTWRLAAALAGIALLTSVIDKAIEQQSIQSQLAEINSQIKNEYQRAFPNAGAYRDVRATMQSKMKALEQGGGASSMLVMLSQLSPAFADSNIKPQSLRFDASRSELRMQVVANNFEALEQFKKLAQAKGFEVEQGAINNKDNQVIGSLAVRS
ncbi:type II secretion system protein GspL [Paraglaciecola hydrolytica]|uniref:Type II secretion system protein L n=1 Tax=Paraglaciecola hydrolytica TaxID=1799789 RepID=A0A135ZZ62_9ALTE|nr:type II secretion system protein GspL [Paraglaciecola hydrolytica]KXI28278.1 type II secretion system protein GspL [Paraglaciecola hydrolytica]